MYGISQYFFFLIFRNLIACFCFFVAVVLYVLYVSFLRKKKKKKNSCCCQRECAGNSALFSTTLMCSPGEEDGRLPPGPTPVPELSSYSHHCHAPLRMSAEALKSSKIIDCPVSVVEPRPTTTCFVVVRWSFCPLLSVRLVHSQTR